MMEQGRMEQYNRETSQIHAPEELIRKTKEAVREEEQRIARAELPQKTAGKRSYRGRVYRWALPAAAAVLMILIGTSGLFFGRGKDRTLSESAADTAANEIAAENDMELQLGAPPEAAAADAGTPIERDGSHDTTEEAAAKEKMPAAAAEADSLREADVVQEDAADSVQTAGGRATENSQAKNDFVEEKNMEETDGLLRCLKKFAEMAYRLLTETVR